MGEFALRFRGAACRLCAGISAMKKLVLLIVVVVAGCNPIPFKQACGMPDFSVASGLKVQAEFATWGYFSERCPVAMPKRFTVLGKGASLNVLVDGEWLRLSARDPSGRPVHLQGSTLQHGGSDARVDQQTDNVFEVDAVSPDGERLGAFRLPFRMQTCTCVTYDGL